jgi:hypothetical protein
MIKDSFTIKFYQEGMRFIVLLAAITALSTGAGYGRAQAMPLIAPPLLGAIGGGAPLLERVANICGMNGCAPVWTKRVRKPPANFVKRAVPLTVVPASQQQNAAPLR